MAREKPECILDALARWGVPIEQLERDVSSYTKPIFDLILQSRQLMEQRAQPWQFKSLAQAGAEDFAVSNPHWLVLAGTPKTTFAPHPLNEAADYYSQEVTRYLAYLTEGVPLYVKEADGNFREANDGDEVWVYVRLLLKHGGWSDLSFTQPPQWATTLYLSRVDMEANSMLHGDPDYSEDPSSLYQRTRQFRLNAFRAFRAGILSDREEQFFVKQPLEQAHTSKNPLPEKLEAAIAAYNAVQANPELRRGRTPKTALGVWLEQNRPGLTKLAREEIAKVANWRPEGGAPRTPEEA